MKKKLITALTLVGMLFMLTGCASNDSSAISLDTAFGEIYKNNGIFTAVLTYPLAQAINYLNEILGSVFWAVVVVTLVLNIIVIAATFKSNMAMQRMQTIQPELQKIQKKYEGRNDQASQSRMAQEMNALYAKYDINPGGALLTSFLQFPILIAMYTAVRRSAAVIDGTFMGCSLATLPKTAFADKTWPLIIIYISMIVFQFLSILLPQMLGNAKAKKEAELHHKHYEKPKQTNAVMTYGMVVFIAYIMLGWPCALSLYYVIVSIVNIIKTLVLNKISEKQLAK